ncbi:FAD-dependent oxidoreductase [Methylocella sp.]|uniref:FAD-dependent oxidoreductase n=1 Tax=Methylocella sp. TaxID=1978226 RepID=UPI0035B24DF9
MEFTRRGVVQGGLLLLGGSFGSRAEATTALSVDVLVYGGAAGGIMAAYAAAREGARVAIVLAGPLGGMPAQGLGWSDTGKRYVIGGLAARFFQEIGAYYGLTTPVKNFEPQAAWAVFRKFLDEADVAIVNGAYLSDILREGRKLTAVRLTNGAVIRAKAFVDASYEGDLLALAGCSYRVGRESRAEFEEPYAGFDALPLVNPAATRNAQGRLFAALLPYPAQQERYSADARIQSYTFRLCLSDDPANMRAFEAPAGYEADRYLFELSQVNDTTVFRPGQLQNKTKYDLNGDYFGASWRWPLASLAERDAIWKAHRDYQAGLLHFYSTDPRVPKSFSDQVNVFGLARDEFTDNDNWPRQLYVREARRLRGHYVMTAKDCTTSVTKVHSIGMGSYSFDSHATALFAISGDTFDSEGTFGPTLDTRGTVPYEIPYESLVPVEYDNLLVSVCVSASHMAFSSIRLEPQYMIMGEAAGCAAGLIARRDVHSLDLRADVGDVLKGYGAIVSLPT